MSEFITFYIEYPKRPVLNGQIDYELKADGIIRKSSIEFLGLSKWYQDYYYTNLSSTNGTALFIKKTDIDVEEQDNHWEQDFKTWKTIKQCINLLSTDGKGTKQQVKEKLEELIKDAKD